MSEGEETEVDIEDETYEEKSIKDLRTVYIISLIGAFIFFAILVDVELSFFGFMFFLLPAVFAILILPFAIYDVHIKLQELEERKQNKANFEVLKTEEMDIASDLHREGGLANLQKALDIYSRYATNYTNPDKEIAQEKEKLLNKEIAREKEKLLDYEGAIADFKELGLHKDAKRVRQKMQDEGKVKVDQKVVHGDEITKTDIKDSVVSRSTIGPGGDGDGLAAKLQQLAQMHRDGSLSDEQFEAAKNKLLN